MSSGNPPETQRHLHSSQVPTLRLPCNHEQLHSNDHLLSMDDLTSHNASPTMSSSPQAQPRRRRREPSSCQMCRVKKLKCDRQRPTRRISCVYSCELRAPGPPTTADTGTEALQAQNDALRDRVLKLEQAVFGDTSADAIVPTTSHSTTTLEKMESTTGTRNERLMTEEVSESLQDLCARYNSRNSCRASRTPLKSLFARPMNWHLMQSIDYIPESFYFPQMKW